MTETEKSSSARRGSPAARNSDNACWICLDGEPDESGSPPVRNCCCRGTAGFVHLRCLADYAKSKCEEGIRNNCKNKFTLPWKFCPACLQVSTYVLTFRPSSCTHYF